MTTLNDRLKAAAAEIRNIAERAPLPVEPMVAEQRRSRVRMPAWAVAGAAATVVLVAVGVPILVFGGGDSIVADGPQATVTSTTVPPTTVPPTTVAPVATTVPPVVPATPMTWDRIDDAVAFNYGAAGIRVMTDIAVRDGIAVAVGFDTADDGYFMDAAVWYSVDGVTWNRVPHDEAVFGGFHHQRMNSVVALESGFLAVGSDGDEQGPPWTTFLDDPWDEVWNLRSESHAAVWRSDDGISWMKVPHVDAFSEADGGAVMNDVALGESGLVAVGLVYGQTGPFATYREGYLSEPRDVVIDVDAAVWRSVDGVSWSRVRAEDETFGGDTVRQSMNAVTAGGPGFVAVGQEGFDFVGFDEWTPIPDSSAPKAGSGSAHVADNVAAVWTSPDGETWTRVANEPSLAHGGGEVTGWATMFDIASHAQGLVAVGRDVWLPSTRFSESWRAAVWLSADGLSWRRAVGVGVDGFPDMHAVTVVADGTLVAGGGVFPYDGGTWTSQDRGDTWAGRPYEDGLFGMIRGLAVFGDKVLAVGSHGGNVDASVWVGTVNDTDG
jgi:hypothetical protein